MTTHHITVPSTTLVAPVKKPRAELNITAGLTGFLAFISIVGSFLFSYPLGGIEGWGTGIVLDVGGVLMAITAYNLPLGKPWAIRLGRYLMGAEFLWSFYKVFIYGESDSTLFFVACIVAFVLLCTPRVRRYEAAV